MSIRANRREKAGSKQVRKDREIDKYESSSDSKESSETGDEEMVKEAPPTINDLVDKLTEKRSQTRIDALGNLNRELLGHYQAEQLSSIQETLADRIHTIVRKGVVKESVLALRSASLAALTLGTNSAGLFSALFATLESVVNDDGDAAVRSSAAEALAVLLFVGNGEQDSDTRKVMTLFQSLWKSSSSRSSDLTVALIENWALLATTVTLSPHERKEIVRNLSAYLDNDSLDVRISAGRAIAFLTSSIPEDEKESTIDEALKQRLQDMSVEGSKGKSKKDKVAQRTAFRRILESVEDGFEPSETMQVRGSKIAIEGWSRTLQMAMFRTVLEGGILVHFQSNPFLCEVFGLQAPEEVDDDSRRQSRKQQISLSRSRAKDQYQHNEKRRREKSAHQQED